MNFFRYRTLKDRRDRSLGKSVPVDTQISELNEFAQVVTSPETRVVAVTATGTVLAAKLKTRYRILQVVLGARVAAASATEGLTVTLTPSQGSSTVVSTLHLVPSVAGVGHLSLVCNVLTEVNTAVTLANITADPTAFSCRVFYQEILEGAV